MPRPKLKRNRTKSGRISRTQPIDKGCDGVIRRRALYAKPANDDSRSDDTQTYDAIGRAWSAGLLGFSDKATQLRDTARAISAQFARFYGRGGSDSLAAFQPRTSSNILPNDERMITARQALDRTLATVGAPGSIARAAFDALCIDQHPDSGPLWLDRIIAGRASLHDRLTLSVAVLALDEIV